MNVLLFECGDDRALYHIRLLHHLVAAGEIFSLCIDYATASKIYSAATRRSLIHSINGGII